ncbi:membrane protein [Bacillus safensis]|nr:membrane protein [Bacillus safensis]
MKINKQINTFNERFSEDIVNIIAVTGPSGVGAGKAGQESLWTASIPLIAWKENGHITTETIRLCWLTDDEGLREKQTQLHKESIVSLQVRKGEREFMLVSLSDVDTTDQELQDILEEAQKPVFYHDDTLGSFELVKGLDLFEKTIQWSNQECLLYFNLEEEEKINDSLQTANKLIREQAKWDSSIKSFAANQLIDLAKDWQEQDESAEEQEDLTLDQFMDRMSFESLHVYPDGEFEVYCHDGDLFWGHVIIVTGNINGTFQDAHIAG